MLWLVTVLDGRASSSFTLAFSDAVSSVSSHHISAGPFAPYHHLFKDLCSAFNDSMSITAS